MDIWLDPRPFVSVYIPRIDYATGLGPMLIGIHGMRFSVTFWEKIYIYIYWNVKRILFQFGKSKVQVFAMMMYYEINFLIS